MRNTRNTRNTKHSQSEKNFRNIMILFALLYFAGGAGFYFEPDKSLGLLNTLGNWLNYDPLPIPRQKFWVLMAVSLMATLGACCFITALKVRRTRHFVIPVLISELFSAALGLLEYLHGEPRRFPYLMVGIIGATIFLILLYYYLRALVSARGAFPAEERSAPQIEPRPEPLADSESEA